MLVWPGEDAKNNTTRAKPLFFGPKLNFSVSQEWKIICEIQCPESGISTNNYWLESLSSHRQPEVVSN